MKKILLLTLSLISICCIQNVLKANTVPTQKDLSDFQDAIAKGNLSKMTEILDKYQNNSKPNAIVNHPTKCVFLTSNYGDVPPLGCAIENRFNKSVVNDVVKILIRYGANVNKGTLGTVTPLVRAVMEGYDDVVKTLVDAKANVNVQMQQLTGHPLTAMDYAIGGQNVNMPTAEIAASIVTTLKNAGAKTGAELNK